MTGNPMSLNGIICINKPAGFTSFDVVAKCRGILRERRIGHGGTLDPMATGVLPLFIGRATAAADRMTDTRKIYTAGFRLGIQTDTYDITGEVTRTVGPPLPGLEEILALLPEFTGLIDQRPPLYSAVKVGGQQLYKLARKGGTALPPLRQVQVDKLTVTADGEDFLLRVECRKGTYVRSLIHDIGLRLGCGGVMTSLVRELSGGFSLADCVTMEQLQNGNPQDFLFSTDRVFEDLPEIELPDSRVKPFTDGLTSSWSGQENALFRVYHKGVFLGLGTIVGGELKAEKLFCDLIQGVNQP